MAGPYTEPPSLNRGGGTGGITIHREIPVQHAAAPAAAHNNRHPYRKHRTPSALASWKRHANQPKGSNPARQSPPIQQAAEPAAAVPQAQPSRFMPKNSASFAGGKPIEYGATGYKPGHAPAVISLDVTEAHAGNAQVAEHRQHEQGNNTISMQGVGSRSYDPDRPVTMGDTYNDHSMRGGPGPNSATMNGRTVVYTEGAVSENRVTGRLAQTADVDRNCVSGNGRRSCFSDLKTMPTTSPVAEQRSISGQLNTSNPLNNMTIAPSSPG